MKKRLLSTTLALALLVLSFSVALAQDATPTPDTWIPPAITKYTDTPIVPPGGTVSFTILVINTGPVGNAPTWNSILVKDPVSTKLTGCTAVATHSGGNPTTVNWSANRLRVTTASLAPQETLQIDISCTMGQAGAGEWISNRASVEYDTPDGVHQGPLFSGFAWVEVGAGSPGESDVPDGDQPEATDPPMAPEASTLLLLGSAATGMAGYVGLQIRARRRDRR